MVQSRFENQQRADQRQKRRDHGALRALARIEGLRERKTGLGRDEKSRRLQRAHDETRHGADENARCGLARDQTGELKRRRRDAGIIFRGH